MKKSSLHFKIAAWSIKNPVQMYVAVTAAVTFLLILCFVVTSMVMKNRMQSLNSFLPSSSMALKSETSSFEKAGWTMVSRQTVSGRECIFYKNTTNGTRLTSCYVQDGKDWVFQQSF